jgi:hypothetical protein
MKWYETIPYIISTVALVVSLLVGWYTAFKPAQVIGDLSYIVVWRFSSNNDGVVTDTAIIPLFWLRNTGALPVVIKDLRVIFVSKDKSKFKTYPVSSIPLSAIENSGEFNEYGRLSTGSPFRGFSLTKSELWTSSYRFSVSSEMLQKLVGTVNVMVQISTNDDPIWKTVIEDSLDFGKMPYHLQKMMGAVQSIPVYTHRFMLRRYN